MEAIITLIPLIIIVLFGFLVSIISTISMVIQEKKVTKLTYDNHDKTLLEYYANNVSREDIFEKSQNVISKHLSCSSKDIQKVYFKLLDELEFSSVDLQELLRAKTSQKHVEAALLKIPIELTPSAIISQLIIDYNLSKIKNV